MSDDKIFFDEQALSVVDSWLGGSSVKANKGTPKVSTSSTAAPLSKVGLGFRGKISEEKPKDALKIRLDKSQKKKKDNTMHLMSCYCVFIVFKTDKLIPIIALHIYNPFL